MLKHLKKIPTRKFWQERRRCAVEKFLNIETALALYFIPTGALIIYITRTQIQNAIETTCYSIGGLFIYAGIYLLFRNPIRREAERWIMVERRMQEERAKNDTAL